MENSHPIEELMQKAMNNIQDMIDVNTIIGEPIKTINNIIIIPISKVCFGFAAGGSEFSKEAIEDYTKVDKDEEKIKYKLPFGGGSGAGVNINPVAFIVVQEKNVKLIPVTYASTIDRIIDYIPGLINKIGKKDDVTEEINNILKEEKREKNKMDEKEYKNDYQEGEELDDY